MALDQTRTAGLDDDFIVQPSRTTIASEAGLAAFSNRGSALMSAVSEPDLLDGSRACTTRTGTMLADAQAASAGSRAREALVAAGLEMMRQLDKPLERTP